MQTVRNFWLEARVEGGSKVALGPRAKDGSFTATIYMRSKGESMKALEIWGHADKDGYLHLEMNSQMFVNPAEPIIFSTKRD